MKESKLATTVRSGTKLIDVIDGVIFNKSPPSSTPQSVRKQVQLHYIKFILTDELIWLCRPAEVRAER